MTNEEAIWTLQEAVDEAFGAGIEIITRDGCEAIEMAIEALEERKTGKWIETGYLGNDNYNFECSECHHSDQHTKAVVVPYCWYCGAKMEVDK